MSPGNDGPCPEEPWCCEVSELGAFPVPETGFCCLPLKLQQPLRTHSVPVLSFRPTRKYVSGLKAVGKVGISRGPALVH